MKRWINSMALIFFWSVTTLAQEKQARPDGNRLEALKVAYLTKQLNLTPEEAQRFWPVYNKYTGEVKQLRMNKPSMDELDMEEKYIGIRKKYKPDFEKVLTGGDRVNRFYKADRDFHMMIQKEMIERRQRKLMEGPRPNGPRGGVQQ